MSVWRSFKVFLTTREGGGNAAPCWLEQSVTLPAAPSRPPPPGRVSAAAARLRRRPRSPGVQRRRRRAAALAPSGKERLSQWSRVHSFMSFESPEEISAKSTEPNVQEKKKYPVLTATMMRMKVMMMICRSSVLGVHPLTLMRGYNQHRSLQ